MATAAEAPEVLEREVPATLPAQVDGNIDVQVATAKRYPRSVTGFMRRATEMATLTTEIASSCVYALPRDGKIIEGPSARLAEIVLHAWGNMRAKAGSEGDDDSSPFITGYGECWDLEANTAVRFEVKRRITNKKGKRYSDDMIGMTGNAAAAIAFRNAIFKEVPSPFWRPVYLKCREVIAGKAETFAARRDEMLKKFNVMGITNEQLYAVLDVKGMADVTLDHMVQITGAYNALKEGELSVEEFVASGVGSKPAPQPAQRKSEQQAQTQTPAPPPPVDPAKPAPTDAKPNPAHVGVITEVKEMNGGAAIVLNTGYKCSTTKPDLMQAAAAARDAQRLVELVTTPSSDPAKYMPRLSEIVPIAEA